MNLEAEKIEQLKLLKAKAQSGGLLSFTLFTKWDYQVNWHHKVLCSYLNKFIKREINRLMIFMPPRNGKPCYIESMILMKDGTRKRLADVRVGDDVITHRGRPKKVMAIHEQGNLTCKKIVTYSGRETIAALDHPFLTPEGWKKVNELRIGQCLANVPSPELKAKHNRTIHEFIMAGYILGDGHVGDKGTFCRMTNADPDIVLDFTNAMCELGYLTRAMPHNKYGYSFVGRTKKHGDSPLLWLRSSGLVGTSWTKNIPDWIFLGSQEQISAFIGAYFSCDGSVTAKGNRRDGSLRKDFTVEMYSVNRDILAGIQHLLLRFGIRSAIRIKNGRYKNSAHQSWRLSITHRDDAAQFRAFIRVIGDKKKRLEDWDLLKRGFRPEYLQDEIVNIENVGALPCRCLTVSDDHTFTSDDFIVHNSELVSRRLPALLHGLFPNDEIMAATYNGELAGDMTTDVQRIMDRPEYKELFPNSKITPEGSVSKYARNATEHELLPIIGPDGERTYFKGKYRAQGIGGSFSGRGAHWILIDDPIKNRDDADSKTARENVWKFYSSTLRTRLEGEGSILLTLTRWHEDDLAGRLMKLAKSDPGADQWTVVKFPAIKDVEENPDDPREIGDPLWPKKFPLEWLIKAQKAGSRDWSALYQQKPTAEDGNIFKSPWFKRYTVRPQKFDQIIQSWDFAVKDKTGADYNVGTIWGRVGTTKYLLDMVRGRWPFPITCQKVLDVSKQYPSGYKKLIEAKANGPAVKQTLDKHVTGIVEVEPFGDKIARANAVSPECESGHVWIPDPSIAPWVNDWLSEMCEFPHGSHDDIVDSSTMAIDYLRKAMPLYLPIAGHGSGIVF